MAAQTCYWDATGENNDWGVAGNWFTTAETDRVPETGDTVIFDGRSSRDATGSMNQIGVDLAGFHVMPSYTGTIGAANAPLIIECSGTMWIQGTGSYYVQCGNGTNDSDILLTIIDTIGSVFLSSQTNASGVNVSLFPDIYIINGAVTLYGGADNLGNDSVGTAFTNIYVTPRNNQAAGITVIIGDECENYKAATAGTVLVREGTVNIYTDLLLLTVMAGACTIGGNAYDMDGDDDNIATIDIYGGSVSWQPTNTTPDDNTASESPAITALNIYGGGQFSAVNIGSTLTTAPTITTITQHEGTIVNLNNGYANIVVSTYTKYGGTLTTGGGQAITLT